MTEQWRVTVTNEAGAPSTITGVTCAIDAQALADRHSGPCLVELNVGGRWVAQYRR